jgi:GPH family glycoside/pentoside/hexuronide:cation symporter
MNPKVSTRVKILYGLGDLGTAMLTATTQFFLMFFYTDVARIEPSLVGTALMVGKLTWDAVNDPLFGYLSDRTRSRWGRRRPYLLFGAIPLALVTWGLFSIPAGLTGVTAFLVVLFSFLLFDTLHSLIAVTYTAMTPELSYDYDERTSITTVREIFTVTGYILGAATTTAIAGLFQNVLGWSENAAYSGMGALFGLIAAAAILTTAFGVKERPLHEIQPSTLPPLRSFVESLKNKPFMWLMGCFVLTNFSFTLLTTLLPYFLTYQMDMAGQIPLVMLAMLLTIGLFLYPMKWLTDRIGKGPAYAAGLFLASLAVSATFLLPYGPNPLVYVIAVVAGMGFSAQWVCPWSMLPDVIEYDQVRTGERREGIFYGMWNFITKFTNAFGIAVAGWALALFGYVANVAQTEQARLGIRLFFGPVPALVILISLPLLVWYPITRASHAELLERLRLQARE